MFASQKPSTFLLPFLHSSTVKNKRYSAAKKSNLFQTRFGLISMEVSLDKGVMLYRGK